MVVLGLVKDLAWQEPVVTGGQPDNVGQTFSVDFATCQPLRSQHSPVISSPDSNCSLPPF